MPQPPPPNVTTKDRFRFRSLLSKNKNPPNSLISASSSVTTLAGNAAPAPSSTVTITTPNTEPELETAATATEAPIADLWNEAWDELRKNTALFEEYETRLTASSSSAGFPGLRKGERAQVMKVLLEKKIEELESGQWKIGFQNNQFAVKDLIGPVAGVVDWAKEHIGKAAQASPYSSVAWAGVCLLLSLVLNPGEKETARAKCLEGIAALLRQCSIREALYRSSYDGNTEKKEANLQVHISYREELKILYVKILTFQATCLCHLSHRTGGRIVRDMVIWTAWDELSTAIDIQKDRMGEIETQWRDFKLQEQWNVEETRHNEQIDFLDPISNEIRRIREVTEKAQNDKIRLGLLQWLSSEDFSARYNDIWSRREELTGIWLIESDRYNDWKKSQSSFLWLYGKAGSGKSYLSASAVHNVAAFCEKSPYEALAYYYFSFTDQTDPDASRMLSSMIRQLCGARPDSPAWLNNLGSTFRDKGARPTLEHLEAALWNAVEGFDAVYLIIDALDECTTSKSKRATLMKSLVKLQKSSPPNVHILVTSRNEPDIEAALDRVPLSLDEKIDLLQFRDAVNHDINIFLQQRLDSPEFDEVSNETKAFATSSLLDKADGMFQYVALQLIEIENSPWGDIPTLLENLPQGLDETYIRMLQRIDSRNYLIVYRILLWIATSEAPLSPTMLAEAAAIDPRAEPPFDPSKRLKGLENPSGLLKLLPGLLVEVKPRRNYIEGVKKTYIRSRKSAITFSHFSVQEFLFSTNLRVNPLEAVSRYALRREEAQYFIAESCMRYHLYASQVKGVTSDNYDEHFPLWEYAANHWASHVEALDEQLWTHSLEEKVSSVLKPNTDSFLNMIRIHSHALSASYLLWDDLDEYSANSVYYLSANGYHRVLSFYLKDLNAEQLHSQINCPPLESLDSYSTPLQAAAFKGSEETVILLLEHGADVNAQGGYYGNALQAAAFRGSKKIVELLLEHGANVHTQGGKYGSVLLAATTDSEASEEIVDLLLKYGEKDKPQGPELGTALHAASYRVLEKMVKLLAEMRSNANTQAGVFSNALQAAACAGEEEIVKILLELGADVNAQGGKYGNALQAAANNRNEEIVKVLLEQGAYVNAQGGKYGNALQAAASDREEGLVKLLLKQGADVNAQGGKYGNALQAAASDGEEGLVKLLLEQGADVMAQGGKYGNILQAAAYGGSEKTFKLILEQGVDVNYQGGVYGNALQAAASTYGESKQIVELLLEQGADVNAQGGKYGHALQAAAVSRRKDVVKLLLEHGADANAQGGEYGNALQAAAWRGLKDIVKLLLEHGANTNAEGGLYGTALQAAVSPGYGSEEVIELLLEHGADVNANTGGKYGSALKAAQNCYEDHILALLLAHGATEQ